MDEYNIETSTPAAQLWAIRPLLDAEAKRGNRGRARNVYNRDVQERNWVMGGPLDIDAINAEFELGSGITVNAGVGGLIIFAGITDWPEFVIRGAPVGISWWARTRRAKWWADWNAAPRPQVFLRNPFAARFAKD